ncbi:MAG: tetratricopeptide repeat protein [Trueperaceae bacterium]|nr:tetratricopeptide repeat protein [Trueperaceae bacterium]
MADFDQYWNYDYPSETYLKFESLLAHYEVEPAHYAELLSQLARCQSLQAKFEEAHALLDQMAERLDATMPIAQIRYRLERGRSYNSAGQKDKAIPLFKEAANLAKVAGEDFYEVDALHMLALASDADEQMLWHNQAISLAEQSQNSRARNWLGSLYNNLGWTLFDQGNYELALATFEKALAFRVEQGQAENIRIAYWCMAKTQRFLARTDKALELLYQLESEYVAGDENSGYVYEEIAECLLSLKHKESASYFAKAYQSLSQDSYLKEHEPERLERLNELSHERFEQTPARSSRIARKVDG